MSCVSLKVRRKDVPIMTTHRKPWVLLKLSRSWEPVRRKHGADPDQGTTGMAVSPRRVPLDRTVFARNCSHFDFGPQSPTFPVRSFGIPCVRSDHTTLELDVEQRQVSFVQSSPSCPKVYRAPVWAVGDFKQWYPERLVHGRYEYTVILHLELQYVSDEEAAGG